MNATLGAEIPNTSSTIQTTIPYYYIDPPIEILKEGETQYLEDHPQRRGHSHHPLPSLRRSVDQPRRLGRRHPAARSERNQLEGIGQDESARGHHRRPPAAEADSPLPLPNSIRPLDVTRPLGSTMGFTNVDPEGNPAPVTNVMTNFGWEYVWHCHLLGHEENDMMRPVIFAVAPIPPSNLAVSVQSGPLRAVLTWTDNSTTETGFAIQRSPISTFAGPGTVTFSAGPNATSYTDRRSLPTRTISTGSWPARQSGTSHCSRAPTLRPPPTRCRRTRSPRAARSSSSGRRPSASP